MTPQPRLAHTAAPMPAPVRLAVFDCDGTLVDSGAVICRAMELAFAAVGLPWPGPDATRRVVGLSLPLAIRAILPGGDAATHAAMAEHYKAAFGQLRSSGQAQEPLYPGIANALETLEHCGWLLGIATGKSDRGLKLCLEAHGLHPRFVTLQTADRHPSKPHPSMLEAAAREAGADHVAMIGDTTYDMAMAVAARADPVGVAWGYHPAAELRAAGARTIAGHAAELPDLLKMRPHG